jgi:Flp pilus assembly pilin Flp
MRSGFDRISASLVLDRSRGRASAWRESCISAGGGQVDRRSFWKDDEGQDLVEYTLLLAMICLASAALMIGSGDAVSGIWYTTNNNLSSARDVSVR